MKKTFTILTAALMLLAMFANPMRMLGEETTVDITMNDYVSNNNCTVSSGNSVTLYTSLSLSTDITMSTSGNPNCGSFWGTSTNDWRLYQNQNGDVTISTSNGTLNKVQIYYNISNSGVLKNGSGATVGTGDAVNVSGNSITLTVGNSGTATNGQVRITRVIVKYTPAGGPTPTTYTVTYDANGGTGTMTDSNSPYTAGATVTVLGNEFTRTDYEFDHWNTAADDSGTDYDEDDTFTINANTTLYAQWTENTSGSEEWILTNLADLTSSDVFVIVGNNGDNFAMKNTGASNSGPVVVAVTVSDNKLTGTISNDIKWNISGDASNGYIFYPNGSSTTWLYCTNNNNGLRIGDGNTDYNTFKIQNNYLYNIGRERYVGIYNSTDWRSYGTINNNISGQSFAFYKRQVVSADPSLTITAPDELAYDATSGSIGFTINNPVATASVHASVPQNSWLTPGTVGANSVPFTCTANQENTERSVTVTLTYVNGEQTLDTKTVTVTQAAAPVVYSTIPALFAAATSTETSVLVTFNNWVVSGVSTNGKNVYVTDNSGNGFIIYFGSDMSSTFSAGNILSGNAVSCTLKTYNGAAEIINLDASHLTITTGGTVSVANIDMDNLSGINTGALVSYSNLSCSLDNNNRYQLSDGTTTIQAYNTLYDFDEFENGKTYNVTGVYVQYNTVKEIAPRSASDIEEVTTTSEYTLTVTTTANVEIFTFIGEAQQGIEGATIQQVNNGTEIGISVSAANGYALVLMVDGTDVTSQLDNSGYYSFYMPAYDVAVSASAVAVTTYTLATTIVSGRHYIITNGTNKAMGAQNNNNRSAVNATIENGIATVTSDVEVSEIVINGPDANNFYTIYDANYGTTGGFLYAASSGSNYLRTETHLDNKGNALWTITFNGENHNAIITAQGENTHNIMRYNSSSSIFSCYENNQQDIYLYVKDETAPTYDFYKDIAAYTHDGITGDDPADGWYLIASPVAYTLAGQDMVSGTDYDLYRFNPTADLEWENYKNSEHSADFTALEVGRGYLYANANDITLSFTGVPASTGEVTAAYTGWNLIGNPLGTPATVDKDYYRMNDTQDGIMTTTGSGNVAVLEGIFVQANAQETVTFTAASKGVRSNEIKSVVLNVMRNNNVIDRAIVRFNSDRQLGKLTLFDGDTKIYFPQSEGNYAIVSSNGQGTMPVNFKAKEIGQYTISVDTEGIDLSYLHLIDRLTGDDINLLLDSKYSFVATNSDMESRFILSFGENNINASNETFAFQSGSDIIVNGEGELQIFDVMGRMVKNTTINGVETIAMPQGVYIFRLNENIQKIVVR